MKKLLAPDSAAGLPADNQTQPAAPVAPPAPAPAPTAAPAPPPDSLIVATGTKSERELELEEELQVIRTERDNQSGKNKRLETDISHLQDELSRLKAAREGEPPAKPSKPAPAAPDAHWTKHFGL